MRDMWRDGLHGKMVLILLAALCLALGAFALDRCWTSTKEFDATVIGRSYASPSTQVGTAFNGKSSSVVVTSDSEHWTVILQDGSWTGAASVRAETWAKCENGMRVKVLQRVGCFGLYVSHRVTEIYGESPK